MSISKKKIIKRLSVNSHEFNVLKTIEELNELATVLTQTITKPGKIPDKEVIEELGDVKLRLTYMDHIYGEENVDERVIEKFIKINKKDAFIR